MISSNQCYLTNKCYRYNNIDKSCQCSDLFCEKLFRVDRLYHLSLLNDTQICETFSASATESGDGAVFAQLQEYERNIESNVKSGNSLYIYGSCGNGKTSWSIRLLKSYIDSIWYKSDIECQALFINVPRFFRDLKASFRNPNETVDYIFQNAPKVDLVVWDEIASKGGTDFEQEQLLNLIDSRVSDGKCNIFTSNADQEYFRKSLGERLYSRVVANSRQLKFIGRDRRGEKK